MIVKLLYNSHIIYAEELPGEGEPAVTVSLDAGGTVVMQQEGREILHSQSMAREASKILKKLADVANKG